jgi:hypothetical protein
MFFDPFERARTAFRRKPFLLRDNLLDSLSAKIEDARPGLPPQISNDQVMERSD